MTTTTHRQVAIVGVPLVLLTIVVLMVLLSPFFTRTGILSWAATFDLLVTIPVVYFLLVRRTNIPKITVVPLFMAGIVIASLLLPTEHQQPLRWVKTWFLPVVETVLLVLIVIKVRGAVKQFKAAQTATPDFYTALQSACAGVLPKWAVPVFATEIAVLYYGFIHWKRVPLQTNEFTYHKKSGTQALLIAFIFLVAAETAVVHLLLSAWSVTAAWVLTGLSTYTAVQLLGFLKSISRRPIAIVGHQVYLRYGILNEAVIATEHIESAELRTQLHQAAEDTRYLSPLGEIEGQNIVIRLKQETTLHGLYGINKTCRAIALLVDDAGGFKKELDSVINASRV
jgi:hypothetical protein